MSAIRLATAANVRAFQVLSQALDTSDGKWSNSIDHDALEDEIGRFRVWSGNLGALQKGHSSLDYRLRDSPLLSSNALKFLKELEENLNEANAVVSGLRLPYEQQSKPENAEEVDDDDDDFFDDDDDEDEGESSSRTELSMRFAEIVDIVDNLYKLSVRIRTPTIRSRSLKAAAYNPDPETGVELLGTYASYDSQHVKELIEYLRQSHLAEIKSTEYDYLINRLSAAITNRRRQFKYWKRHRDKLGGSTTADEHLPAIRHVDRPDPQRNGKLEVVPDTPVVFASEEPSQKTGKTMMSGTEATKHHQSLDEIVDTKSVTSYAVTVRDIHGKGVDLPPPPRTADGDKDFECPYCYIICPARYGRGRAWRTHLLQDLQPYICTYPDCDSAEQLFRSRREWAAHEATHRKAWRCPEHPEAIFKTQSGLEDHLRREHLDSFLESQLPTMIKVGETSTVDTRTNCPVCCAPAEMDGVGEFHNHIANHLERIATFALPSGIEDEEDGASSIASRGRSESIGSRDIDGMSLPSDTSDELLVEADSLKASKPDPVSLDDSSPTFTANNQSPEPCALLSAESLQELPDGSQNRVDTLLASIDAPERRAHFGSDDDDDNIVEEELTEEMKKRLAQREAFRAYLRSFPGCNDVGWFYQRSRSWTGYAVFDDDSLAVQALKDFDEQRFPLVRIHQNTKNKNELNFMAVRRMASDVIDRSATNAKDIDALADTTVSEDVKRSKELPIMEVSEIPTLSSMYRTRKLVQRDQSVAPNASYNQIISFCYYSITKLKVDAIINSSNRTMKMKGGHTLNDHIHKAAGPELAKEASTHGKLGTEPILTSGYNLPSAHVIHVNRPEYSNSNSTGQFNQLKDCYLNSLRTAYHQGLKTIAFPCLGAGNVGFPHRVAARIAVQTVREYLDAPREYAFERIIFCIYTPADEQAYLDFLPVYFPPTHDDMDLARSALWSEDRAAIAIRVLDTRTLVQKVFADLSNLFSVTVPSFPESILSELAAIDSNLASIRTFLLWADHADNNLADLKLTCSVMQSVCANITEITQLAKDTDNTAARTHQSIWDDSNADMKARHGTTMADFLQTCRDFIECLDDIITRDGAEIEEMIPMRHKLAAYRSKRTYRGVESVDNRLSAFDEVLYLRNFQREAAEAPPRGKMVKLNQIPSVAQLYKLDELQEKNTLAQPSAMFNHTVCFVRENITKLAVDVIVNSTDVSFSRMGTLDRSVFAKGGPEMEESVKPFVGTAKIGDVKTTAGYQLPAKHVLHAIPPDTFGQDTKTIFRNIYRDILHTAVSLRATSIAIPSIGTGMSNYPRKDSASLAIEEVKRFLETTEPNSLLKKIVFVVYSSNDEFIYKSLLPVYFPPIDLNVNRALPASRPVDIGNADASQKSRRTLFESIGEAVRSVRFGQQPESTRPITADEEFSLINFESHAATCSTCKDPKQLYFEGRDLCEAGYNLAQIILFYMNMRSDQKIYTKPDSKGKTVELQIDGEVFPICSKLLEVIERSYREAYRSRPFVSANQSYAAIVQDQTPLPKPGTQAAETEEFNKARAHVLTRNGDQQWDPLVSDECSIRVYHDSLKVYPLEVEEDAYSCLLVAKLQSVTQIYRRRTTPEVRLNFAHYEDANPILLRCRSDAECNSLLRMLRRAIERLRDEGHKIEATFDSSEKDPAPHTPSSLAGVPSGDNYRQWSQRLKEIRDQLSTNKKPRGGLQSKIDTLSRATSSLQPDREDTKEPSHQGALAILLLDYLKQDLKTRRGSYTGMKFDDIVSGLRMTPAEAEVAINELSSRELIHKTVDDSTWVVSDTTGVLSVLPSDLQDNTQQPSEQTPASQDEAGETAVRSIKPDAPSTKRPLSDLAEWILSYIPHERLYSSEPGFHREISLKKNVSVNNVEEALQEISDKTRWYHGGALVLEPGVVLAGNPYEHYDAWTLISKRLVNPWVLRMDNIKFEEFDEAVLIHRVLCEGELIDWAQRSRESRGDVDANRFYQPRTSHEQHANTSDPSQPLALQIRAPTSFNDTPPSPTTATARNDPQHPTHDFISPSKFPSLYPDPLPTLHKEDDTRTTPLSTKHTRLDKALIDPVVLGDVDEPFDDAGDSIIVHRVLRRGEIERWADKTRELRREREQRERRGEIMARARGKGKGREKDDDEQGRLESVLAGDREEGELRYFAGDGEGGRGV